MTRAEKIQKLANAIKTYRGSYHPDTKQWIRPPKPSTEPRVIAWLERLKIYDIPAAMKTIREMKHIGELHAWLNGPLA